MKINMIAYTKMRCNPVEYYCDLLLFCYKKKVKYARRKRWLRLYNYFNAVTTPEQISGECAAEHRGDGKNVIFQRVEQ